jgi:hypothetical protein
MSSVNSALTATTRSRSASDRPACFAAAPSGPKNTCDDSTKNELPIQPSASSPVSARFAGPSAAM